MRKKTNTFEFDEDALAEFMVNSRAVGWIDPAGKVYSTPLYEHVLFFLKHPEAFPEMYEIMRTRKQDDENRQAYDWTKDLRDNQDPEWHRFEVVPYNPREHELSKLRHMAYEAGWGRIGNFYDGIELECFEEHLPCLKQKFKDFAEMLGREPKLNPIDQETREDDAIWHPAF